MVNPFGSIAFTVFGVPIYFYGLIMAIAVLAGFLFSYYVCKRFYKDIDAENLFNIATIVIIFGFIFARLYYCLLNFSYYSANPIEIIMIRQGGLSIQGGVLGAFLAGVLYTRYKHLPTLKIADILTYGLVLAQIIGRWGNFFNNEAFGEPTNAFWGLYIPIGQRPIEYISYSYFHPTFLYESIANLLILFILFFIVRKLVKNIDGAVFASYLILYSIVRFFIEGIRIDSVLTIANLEIAQIFCIIITIPASIFLIYKLIKQ